jgi:hypothetical protein
MNELIKIYPNELTGKEIVRRITEVYHAGYDLTIPDFNVYEQLLACESLDETEREDKTNYRFRENVRVNGNDNDTGKQIINFELKESKKKLSRN